MPRSVRRGRGQPMLFGQKYAALGSAVRSGIHRFGVGGADFVVVVNVACRRKIVLFTQRRDHLRQQQIGHGAQLVAGCGMAGDIHAQPAQLLNQPPYLGPAGANFFGDLGAAGDDRSVAPSAGARCGPGGHRWPCAETVRGEFLWKWRWGDYSEVRRSLVVSRRETRRASRNGNEMKSRQAKSGIAKRTLDD